MHSEKPRGFFGVYQGLKISLTLNLFSVFNVLDCLADGFIRVL
jgi:hypothetical protein